MLRMLPTVDLGVRSLSSLAEAASTISLTGDWNYVNLVAFWIFGFRRSGF